MTLRLLADPADPADAAAAGGAVHQATTWREVFAVRRPRLVAGVVVGVAAAIFSYEAVLITVFDARSWWGHNLAATSASFSIVFAVVAILGLRRARDRRSFLAFVVTAWATVSAVSWLPRQRPPAWPELGQLAWWAGWCMAIYVSVPILYAAIHRTSIRSYGLRLGMFRGELRIFAILLPAIFAGAYLAAGQARFQQVYPFYTDWTAGRGTVAGLLTWWAMYAASFVALEFFYRGFMVTVGFGLVGWWAIPAMAAPYCLLHLDKPLPEMITSLFGGLLLGVVALRTRSILAGVLAHVTLAVGTDGAVLLRR